MTLLRREQDNHAIHGMPLPPMLMMMLMEGTCIIHHNKIDLNMTQIHKNTAYTLQLKLVILGLISVTSIHFGDRICRRNQLDHIDHLLQYTGREASIC